MVAQKNTPERVNLTHFFERKPLGQFDLYGLNPMVSSELYKGSIPGHPLGYEKLNVLNQYRFCICFENSYINGYITEKIFSCFAAGCIPVYIGAPNVVNYIPKDCFIDYRDFSGPEDLYTFLTSMPESVYLSYISRIRSYLESEQSYLFSAEHFLETVKGGSFD